MLVLLATTALAAVGDATPTYVLTSTEHTALGGAGIGFARGCVGLQMHPAAPVNRLAEEGDRFHFDYLLSWGSIGPGGMDLSNLGPGYDWSGYMAGLGLTGAWGNAAGGFVFSNTSVVQGDRVIGVTDGHVTFAGSFGERMSAGLGWRPVAVDLRDGDERATYAGSALEAGILLADPANGWNVGFVARSPAAAGRTGGELDLGIDEVRVANQLSFGAAWARRASELADAGMPIRLAVDAVADGPVEDGLALEPLLAGQHVARGASGTLSLRAGVEIEPWLRRLKLRAGSYSEPSRTDASLGRIHGTAGFELKLFHLKGPLGLVDDDIVWRTAVDGARGYLTLGYLSVGTWNAGVVTTGAFDGPMGNERVPGGD